MKTKRVRGLALALAAACVFPQALSARSFDDIFPGLGTERKKAVFAEGGVIRSSRESGELEFLPAPGSGIDILSPVMERNPGYLTESLAVVPYAGRALAIADLYNALGQVRGLKGRLYHSATRDEYIPLFEDAARVSGRNRNDPVPDPRDRAEMPAEETVYLRLKDVNFGNSFYRAGIRGMGAGILYSLSNTRPLSYLVFTVMKEDRFTAQLYLEPLDEGVLVYSMAGAEVSDFIARRVSIPSAIQKRLAIFIGWITDGLRARM